MPISDWRLPNVKTLRPLYKPGEVVECIPNGQGGRGSIGRPVEGMRYNTAVQALNTYYRSFFGGFFCRRAGVEMTQFYTAPEAKHEAPKVKF